MKIYPKINLFSINLANKHMRYKYGKIHWYKLVKTKIYKHERNIEQ